MLCIECKHIPLQGSNCETWRYECVQSSESVRPQLHADRHPLLCKSRGMERRALHDQEWHMVSRLRALRNAFTPPTLSLGRYARAISSDSQGKLQKAAQDLLVRSFIRGKMAPIGKPRQKTDLWLADPTPHIQKKAGKTFSGAVPGLRARERDIRQLIRKSHLRQRRLQPICDLLAHGPRCPHKDHYNLKTAHRRS